MVADGTAYSSSRHRTKLVVRRQVPISSSPDVLCIHHWPIPNSRSLRPRACGEYAAIEFHSPARRPSSRPGRLRASTSFFTQRETSRPPLPATPQHPLFEPRIGRSGPKDVRFQQGPDVAATAILQPSSRNVRVVVAVRPSSERAIRCTDPVADSVQATSAAPASARKRNRGLNRLTLLHHVDLPADGDRVDRGQRRLREHQRQRLFAGGRRARPTATARGREEARLPTAGGNPARQLSLQPVATGVAHGGDDMDRKHF